MINGSRLSPTIPGTTFPCTRAAAVTMRTVWRRKEVASVRRFKGKRKPVVLEQKKLPMKKNVIAMRACSHARG